VVTYSKEIIWFVLILVVVVVLMCLIPQLVVYLPNLVFGE
jgi:TRAP-type C4-dicarboxylate transport system permease large subunit